MDLGFTRFAPLRADPAPVPLDYMHLIAGLAAMQAASRTAATEARLAAGTFSRDQPLVALVELLTAGPAWHRAANALEHSFHARIAAENGSFPP